MSESLHFESTPNVQVLLKSPASSPFSSLLPSFFFFSTTEEFEPVGKPSAFVSASVCLLRPADSASDLFLSQLRSRCFPSSSFGGWGAVHLLFSLTQPLLDSSTYVCSTEKAALMFNFRSASGHRWNLRSCRYRSTWQYLPLPWGARRKSKTWPQRETFGSCKIFEREFIRVEERFHNSAFCCFFPGQNKDRPC